MLLHSILIILGLLLIVGCCVIFTNAIEHLGKACNLNEGAVGSILAAVGTALPETIVPLVAILGAYLTGANISDGEEIGIGAILGSPFLLSTLAMFITACAILLFTKTKHRHAQINADYKIIIRDLKFFLISYTIAILAAFIHLYTIRIVVACMLIGYYLFYVFRTIRRCQGSDCEEELDELLFYKIFKKYNLFLIWLQIILSILGLIYFSHVFVEQIKYFSELFEINPLILSLILAPIATELPEMFNSVLWVNHSKDQLALGNITGAMVFQSCIPASIGILLTPWIFGAESLINIALVYIATLLIFITTKKIKSLSAEILLVSGSFYIVYVIYILSEIIN